MKGWLFLVIAIVGEVIATSALKSSEGFTKLIFECIARTVRLEEFLQDIWILTLGLPHQAQNNHYNLACR